MKFVNGVDLSSMLVISTLLLLSSCKSTSPWYIETDPKLVNQDFTFTTKVDTVNASTYLKDDELVLQLSTSTYKRFRFIDKSLNLNQPGETNDFDEIFNIIDPQYPRIQNCLKRGEYLYSTFGADGSYVILDTTLFQLKYNSKNRIIWEELMNFRQANLAHNNINYRPDVNLYTLIPNIVKTGNQLIFPIYSGELDLSGKTRNYMIGTLNLVTKEFDVLDLPLPDFYSQEHLGLLNNFSIFNHSKGVGVAFAMQPVIILTDSTLTVSDTIGIRSVYDTLPPLSFDKKDNLRMRMTKTILYDGFYRGLFYNSAKKHYYIFYQIRQKELREDGLNNTFEDRRCSFIILNENFEKIGEYLLPEGIVNTMRVYPTKSGAFFYSPLTEAGRLSRPNDMLKVEINYE